MLEHVPARSKPYLKWCESHEYRFQHADERLHIWYLNRSWNSYSVKSYEFVTCPFCHYYFIKNKRRAKNTTMLSLDNTFYCIFLPFVAWNICTPSDWIPTHACKCFTGVTCFTCTCYMFYICLYNLWNVIPLAFNISDHLTCHTQRI